MGGGGGEEKKFEDFLLWVGNTDLVFNGFYLNLLILLYFAYMCILHINLYMTYNFLSSFLLFPGKAPKYTLCSMMTHVYN